MANASATAKSPRRRRRRARAATFLATTCHRLLRFLATRRLRLRLRRRGHGLDGDSYPSGHLPLTRASSTPQEAEATDAAAAQPRQEERHGDDDAAATEAGKYWVQRHSLFSLYDRGVRMDAEGWYSATPESIAAAQAARAPPGSLVLDAFAGVGGNSIQFAARGCYVVAVEIDPRKVELAAHNARIYGVEDMIEFVVGDFFHLAPSLKADLVFLSPPWGGPSYSQAQVYSLDMLKPRDGYTIFQAALEISPNVIIFLPRNVDISQVEQLSWLSSPPLDFVSEENYIEHRFKGITAYFGGVAQEALKQEQISS